MISSVYSMHFSTLHSQKLVIVTGDIAKFCA